MKYDFETRNPKDGVVHPFLGGSGITDPGIIPYSVAEMRFNLAPEITAALMNCVEAGGFGYTMPSDSYKQAVCNWMETRHNWKIQPDWLVQTYGVVAALDSCVKAFSSQGDGILIQSPVYPPFSRTVLESGRRILSNKLVRSGDTYVIDFSDFEEKAKQAKVFLLCSPHNPVGRVWTKAELLHMARICIENNVLMVSDEIHNDLIMPGYTHTVLAKVLPELEDRCVVCTAPSKTFNIAGLATSNIIIKNPEIRKKFSDNCEGFINVPGLAACEAAYSSCAPWLEEALEYLDGNRRLVMDFFAENLPKLKTTKLEGTYLMFIDMSALGFNKDSLREFLTKKAQLVVNDGESFGAGGEGFIRFNIACPRRYIQQALERLKAAVDSL